MKVYIVDLGSQWTHRIWRTMRDIEVDAKIVPVTTKLSEMKDASAFIFSGGAVRLGLGETEELKNCSKIIDEASVPIMGVCAGQQYIGSHFGGNTRPSKGPEFGKVELVVDDKDELFAGLPDRFTVWASHNDEVVAVPDFKVLAHSEKCSNHAMKHKKKPIYGTLFHPEVEHTEHGEEIYKNFLSLAKC